MSTAVGHGLADPNARGKPVSHAKRGGGLVFGDQMRLLRGYLGSQGRDKTHTPFPCRKGLWLKFQSWRGGPSFTLCSLFFSEGGFSFGATQGLGSFY